MFRVKDNKQGYIFDPFEYLGPKRISELKIHGPKFVAVRYFQNCLLSLFAKITTTRIVVRTRK